MYKNILQKALIFMIYEKLKLQILILENTRHGEKKSNPQGKDRYDDRISQRSISIALKGSNNPNWLNDIFRENKDIGLSSYISVLGYIKEKYGDYLLESQFSLKDFVTDNILAMGTLLNRYVVESREADFDINSFFEFFPDELLDELSEVLGELATDTSLSVDEEKFLYKILDALSIDYSQRERLEGDEKNEV